MQTPLEGMQDHVSRDEKRSDALPPWQPRRGTGAGGGALRTGRRTCIQASRKRLAARCWRRAVQVRRSCCRLRRERAMMVFQVSSQRSLQTEKREASMGLTWPGSQCMPGPFRPAYSRFPPSRTRSASPCLIVRRIHQSISFLQIPQIFANGAAALECIDGQSMTRLPDGFQQSTDALSRVWLYRSCAQQRRGSWCRSVLPFFPLLRSPTSALRPRLPPALAHTPHLRWSLCLRRFAEERPPGFARSALLQRSGLPVPYGVEPWPHFPGLLSGAEASGRHGQRASTWLHAPGVLLA